MKICILAGSPRKNGNTMSLVKVFMQSMEEAGHQCEIFSLYDKDIRPCTACRCCQTDWTAPHCAQEDDCDFLFEEIAASDLLIFASPIYSFYCTPPMKALLDRLVYAMNKYYGAEKGPSLWEGKKVALITTCGYRPERGADLFEEGMRRYCRHSRLHYLGMLSERHLGYDRPFMDDEKACRAKAFAANLIEKIT